MQTLLAAIRQACPAGLWAQAEHLVRTNAVVIESSSSNEVVARVRSLGRPSGATAVLYPEEQEWACDCAGADPCAHVAALALTLQAQKTGSD